MGRLNQSLKPAAGFEPARARDDRADHLLGDAGIDGRFHHHHAARLEIVADGAGGGPQRRQVGDAVRGNRRRYRNDDKGALAEHRGVGGEAIPHSAQPAGVRVRRAGGAGVAAKRADEACVGVEAVDREVPVQGRRQRPADVAQAHYPDVRLLPAQRFNRRHVQTRPVAAPLPTTPGGRPTPSQGHAAHAPAVAAGQSTSRARALSSYHATAPDFTALLIRSSNRRPATTARARLPVKRVRYSALRIARSVSRPLAV